MLSQYSKHRVMREEEGEQPELEIILPSQFQSFSSLNCGLRLVQYVENLCTTGRKKEKKKNKGGGGEKQTCLCDSFLCGMKLE